MRIMFTDKLSKMIPRSKNLKIVTADTNNGFVQCYHDAVMLLPLVTRYQLQLYNSTEDSSHNLGKDLLAEKTLLADQR